MRSAALVAVALALAVGCGKAPQRAPAPPARVAAAVSDVNVEERENLMNIAYGASVVSRTAELTLKNSAVQLIDGDYETAWISPPNDPLQTVVLALPSRSLIEKIGVRLTGVEILRPTGAAFETSLDGSRFMPLVKESLSKNGDVLLFPVPPTEAVYVRLTTLGTVGSFATIQSLQVRGKLLERPVAHAIDGCWTINGQPATFVTVGGAVHGTIGSAHPIFLTGDADGPVYRFAWVKKGDWGYFAITVAPDGKHLSGARWYEEPIVKNFGDSWFGERSACGAAAATGRRAIAPRFLERLHRYPLFGLRFDATGRLLEADSVTTLELFTNLSAQHPSQRFRLVSREYRAASTEDNRRRAQARLDSLRAVLQKRGVDLNRVEFVAAGSDQSPRTIENQIMRVLYSVVDIEPSVEGR